MKHVIRIPENFAKWDPISKIQWVEVDGKDRVPLICESADKINQAIADLYAQLEEADRQREEIQTEKKYSKLKLYLAICGLGKWETFKSWLQNKTIPGTEINAYEAFNIAQDLSNTNELFNLFLEEAKTVLEIDDATANAILKESEIQE